MIRRALFLLLLLLVAVPALVLALAATPWARDAVVQRLLAAADGNSEAVAGSLYGPLTLRGLRLPLPASTPVNEGGQPGQLQVRRLELDWQWSALLAAQPVASVTVTGVRLTLPGSTGPTPPEAVSLPVPPDLPISAAQLDWQVAGLRIEDVNGTLLAGGLRSHGTLALAGQELRLSQATLSLPWPQPAARGQQRAELELAGTVGWAAAWPLELSAGLAVPGDLPLALSLAVQGPALAPSLSAQLQQPLQLQAEGQLQLDRPDPAATLALRWPEQAWPVVLPTAVPGQTTLAAGSATLDGTAANLQLALDSAIDLGQGPASVSVQAQWQDPVLRLDQLAVQPVRGAALTGRGRLDLSQQQFSLQLASAGLDLSALLAAPAGVPALPAAITLATELDGRWGARPQVDAMLDLHSDWLDQPLSLAGTIGWRPGPGPGPGVLQLANLQLLAPGNRIVANGTLAGADQPDNRMQLALDLTDLTRLWPGLAGSVQGQVELASNQWPGPVQVQLAASGLRWQDWQLASLQAEGNTGIAANTQLTVVAEGLNGPAVQINRLDLVHALQDNNHQLTLTASSNWGRLVSRLNGRIQGEQVVGQLQQLAISDSPTGDWRSAAEVAYRLDNTSFQLADAFCLAQASGTGRVCVQQLALDPTGTSAAIRLHDLPLALANPFLPRGINAAGALQGQLDLAPGQPLRVALRHQGGTLAAALPGSPDWETELRQLSLDLSNLGDQFTLQAAADLGRTGTLGLVLGSTPASTAAAPDLAGHLQLDLLDLDLVTALAPPVQRAVGHIAGRLEISGSPAAPVLAGALEMTLEELLVPPLAPVQNLHLRLAGTPDGELQLTGRADAANGGHLALDGQLGPWHDGRLPARVQLRGAAWPALDQPDLALTLSPDLTAIWDGSAARVTGQLTVPSANIRFEQVGARDLVLSDDVVIHGSEADDSAAIPLVADLRIIAGDEVHLGGAGLAVQLGGALNLRSEPGRPLQASGSVRTLSGHYRAYGQRLTIHQGRLEFAGPIDNPTVAIRAGRSIEPDIEVGFQLSGFLRNMQADLYSQPTMADADALAYLVAGKSLAGTSASQASMVNDAAVSLGVAAAAPITAAVRKRLGIDQLGVENATDPETGALMIGKQLTDDVYVKYSYGLFNRGGGLLVRWRLGDRLSLQTEAGSTRAIDLLYAVEFDQLTDLRPAPAETP